MTVVGAPAPFRIAFDSARDPYTARNALGIMGTGAGFITSVTAPLSVTGGVLSINLSGYQPIILVSDTPPVGAADNSLWYESDTGKTFLRYNDGSSTQWVLLAAVGAVTFTPVPPIPPAVLASTIGWWDASVTASLTLSGSDILSVADQSGLGNTMNWNSAKPTYNATGFNTSYPAFMIGTPFTSSLRAAVFPMGTGNTLTTWAVCSAGASGSQSHARMLSYGNPRDFDNAGAWFIGAATGTQAELFRNSTAAVATATAHPALHRIIGTIDATGVRTVYVDGVAGATSASGGNWISGGQLTIGRSTATSDGNLITPMAECGIATSYSNATTVGQLDSYLKTKWGL